MYAKLVIRFLVQMKSKSKFLKEDGEFNGEKGYGAVIGTLLVCSWVEIVLAFVRPQVRVYHSRPVHSFGWRTVTFGLPQGREGLNGQV